MKIRKNQKGFSLIELMMVVVIIGVLAGVGVPQYQKFQMRAKQSEVKTLLSSMYTSQRAFFAEWNQYYGDFNAVGYGLSGDLGYFMAFAGAGASGPAVHPNATYRNAAPAVVNATQFCGALTAGATGVSGAGGCTTDKARSTTAIGITSAQLNTFTFGGVANLDSDGTEDQWIINELKSFTQRVDDIAN